ncbi:hypothetical protein J25TS5_30720 [Paenibacillus faecis]|uniref:hypothetical protein n=1 Tax=Paenibacillus faecis TaxID=862114 RepID=UPI001AFDC4C3|nr:hypothetical protein [Paenibacillus faecis]GIO86140.1 hypothetical protein J25TS5_30720 [Paenibacillus faecis]
MEKLSQYKKVKHLLRSKNISEAEVLIYELLKRDGDSFFRNALFEGVLPEPLEMDFKDNEELLVSFFSTVMAAIKNFTVEEKVSLFLSCQDLLLSINMIRSLNESNSNELYKDGLFDIPVKQMIHMLCVFLENQNRFSDIELSTKIKKHGFVDIMQSDVADMVTANGSSISLTDNIEAGIEIINTLVAYLFYMGRKEINDEYIQSSDVSPYDLPNINKISKLGLHRHTLNLIWEKVKYQNWRPKSFKHKDEIIHYFQPQNKNDFRLERAAIERGVYKDRVEVFNNVNKKSVKEELLFVYSKTTEASKSVDLYNVETLFNVKNELYLECINQLWNQNRMHVENLRIINDHFLENKHFGINNEINFNIFLNVVFYLQILGSVYSSRSHYNFDETKRANYRLLVPVVKRDQLISHFISLFDYDQQVVAEVLDLLTYKPKPKDKKIKYLSDLFSQPLVYVGKNERIFVPALTKQLNIARMIEQQISLWGIEVSTKGYGFEEGLTTLLQVCPQLKVNTNKISFVAYDGKTVEFDFIAMFENKILLIEMKCLRRQYSPKEYYLREKDVLYGVEQVNRRVSVLRNNWEEVKQRVSIKLPSSPPREEDIIKLVCLNVLDFTGRKIDGVSIIDESMLLKYFLSGEVHAKSISVNGSNVIEEKSIWSKGYPTVEEFLDFLEMPIALKGFYESLEEQRRWLMLIKESDFKIGFCDFVLTKNPFELDFKRLHTMSEKQRKKVKQRSNKKKIAKRKKLDRKKQRGR